MSEFVCDICFKVFNHKGKYNDHLRRLTPCGPSKEPATTISQNDCSCMVCFKTFVNKHSRIRHETKTACALKIQEMKEEASQIKEVIEKNKMLEEKLEKLEKLVSKDKVSITDNSIKTTNTNSHNTVNNHITINVHGKEDLSHITDKQYMHILNRGFKSMKEYVLKKYFSPDMPGNANVYNSDFKNRYLFVFDSASKWVLKDKKDVLDSMYDANYEELHSKYMDLQEEYKLKTPQFESFVKKYEDEIIKKTICEDMKMVLFNERDKALKNKKQSCC